jgi:hypothetical protein|tara:strand:+ start:1566 stop:1742 length:177 start_codon:yes stop_codon:yes gene_type:complete
MIYFSGRGYVFCFEQPQAGKARKHRLLRAIIILIGLGSTKDQTWTPTKKFSSKKNKKK